VFPVSLGQFQDIHLQFAADPDLRLELKSKVGLSWCAFGVNPVLFSQVPAAGAADNLLCATLEVANRQ